MSDKKCPKCGGVCWRDEHPDGVSVGRWCCGDCDWVEPLPCEEIDEECPHCGAKMREYWHSLTPGLVKALVKMRAGIAQSRVNKINPSVDLDGTDNEMTKNERSNLSKLRFHGLIAKVKEAGERQQGEWLITRRGFSFLRGEEQVPARVKTYRNRVVDHDTRLVNIGDVIGSVPYFERIQDIEYDAPQGQRSLLWKDQHSRSLSCHLRSLLRYGSTGLSSPTAE